METLKLNKETARKLYPTAAPEFKKMLEETFGENNLKQKVTDRIKSIDDACRELGIPDASDLIIMFKDHSLTSDMESISAYAKLIIITRALNEGWTPDWSDSSEIKYYPWFNMGSSAASGFSFDGFDFVCVNSHSGVAARLCFKSRALAEYAGKKFEDLYRSVIKG